MGTQLQTPHFLVVMANKDVYYITVKDAPKLIEAMNNQEITFQFIDAKQGTDITLQVPNVQSVISAGSN